MDFLCNKQYFSVLFLCCIFYVSNSFAQTHDRSSYVQATASNGSLSKDSSQIIVASKFHPLSLPAILLPAMSVAYGLSAMHDHALRQLNISTKNEILEDHPHFMTGADNYLQFSPAIAVLGLDIGGVHGRHSITDQAIIYSISSVIMFGSVEGFKNIIHEERPDRSAFNSFPSGHTATAFAAAELLREEYGNHSLLISIGGYAAATITGVLRLYNNRHWVSDVVAGAGIGFFSTRVAYAIYPWLKNKLNLNTANCVIHIIPAPEFAAHYAGGALTIVF